jgi:hypothetical protein
MYTEIRLAKNWLTFSRPAPKLLPKPGSMLVFLRMNFDFTTCTYNYCLITLNTIWYVFHFEAFILAWLLMVIFCFILLIYAIFPLPRFQFSSMIASYKEQYWYLKWITCSLLLFSTKIRPFKSFKLIQFINAFTFLYRIPDLKIWGITNFSNNSFETCLVCLI